MNILGDLQKFNQDAWVDLYVLDTTLKGGSLYHFHSGTNELRQPVVWQGNTYQPLPVVCTGFVLSSTSYARPKLQIANASGVFSMLMQGIGDLVGCKVTRKRTTIRYLDAVNFASGNPNANPSEHLPDDIFYISRKSAENKVYVEFELASVLELNGVMLPKKQVMATVCPFMYRQDECGYTGGAVADSNDIPTSDITKDKCSHTTVGCALRFGANGTLRFGGYPMSGLS